MKLSKVERWMLSNQFRILERLDPEGNDRDKAREIVQKGYEKHYGWLSDYIYDDVLAEEQCSFVFDVITMYEAIQRAYDDLGTDRGSASTTRSSTGSMGTTRQCTSPTADSSGIVRSGTNTCGSDSTSSTAIHRE